MKSNAWIWSVRCLYVSGALIALLGVIHLVSGPGVRRAIPAEVPGEFQKAFMFMFAATGAAVIFAGILVMAAAYGIKRLRPGARMLAFASGLFAILVGAGAVAGMPRNLFSYGLLVLGISVLPPLMLMRRGRFEGGDVLGFHRDAPKDKRTLH
jgi:hypothetical protein